MIELKGLCFEVTPSENEKLERYMDEVLKRNRDINLTAVRDRDEFIQKHIIDSLVFAGLSCIKEAKNIIDAGTGAGFPGIPLAVIYPDKQFVLMDSISKKLKVIEEIATLLLSNPRRVQAVCSNGRPCYRQGC